VQGVPGFVPRVLRDADVGLFRADERVFDAMLDGWKAQMLARGLTPQTIEGRCRLRRFQEFAGTYPWTWRPVDLDDYMAGRRSGEKPISPTTLRSDSNAIDVLCLHVVADLRVGRVL
jgi:integrase/recombinase XerD